MEHPLPFATGDTNSLLGDIVNSVCRSFVLDIYGGVTAALKRAFTLQTAVEVLFPGRQHKSIIIYFIVL